MSIPETGLNYFELRDYDSDIGRWLATDPYGQYWSPYTGMGNMPHMGVNEDGGFSFVGAAVMAIMGSAKASSLVCSCTAAGQGSTEADDIRQAITRCLNELILKRN